MLNNMMDNTTRNIEVEAEHLESRVELQYFFLAVQYLGFEPKAKFAYVQQDTAFQMIQSSRRPTGTTCVNGWKF